MVVGGDGADKDLVQNPEAVEMKMDSMGVEQEGAKDDDDVPQGCGLGQKINDFLERRFYSLGLFIASRPYITIAVCLLLVGIVGSGFSQYDEENRSDKLWVPDDSEAQEDKKHVDLYYELEVRPLNFILEGILQTENVLTAAGVAKAKEAHDLVEAMGFPGTGLSYETKCYRRGVTCWQSTPFEFLEPPYGPVVNASVEQIAAMSDAEILAAVNEAANAKRNGTDSSLPEVASVFGGIVRNPFTGQIYSASALSAVYYLRNDEYLDSTNTLVDPNADALEQGFLDTIGFFSASQVYYHFERFAIRAFRDEFSDAIDNDIRLLYIAIVALLTYLCIMMSRWKRGWRGMRVSLAFGAIVGIGFAIVSSYGLCMYFGLFYSPLMSVLPFLLLGIGVDDAFILVSALDNTRVESGDIVERIAKALSVAGPSITVTSLTDFFAFLVGSSTSLPALRNFSIYAAFGVLFDFIFQVTLFCAFMTLDTRRMQEKAYDIFCCFGKTSEGEEKEDSSAAPSKWSLGSILARLLSSKVAKYSVLVVAAAILATGIAGTSQIEVDADVNDFLPPDSYILEWKETIDLKYAAVGPQVGVYTTGIDIASVDIRLQRLALTQAFKANPYVISPSVRDWYTEFLNSDLGMAASTKQEFETNLWYWLRTPDGVQFRSDVEFANPEAPLAGIVSSRMTGNHLYADKSQDKVKMMDSLRDWIESFNYVGAFSFVYADEYPQWEQYAAITSEAARNIGMILAIIAVVVFILLARPVAASLVIFCIAATIVEIVGFMHFWDLTIDSVTVIMLVIALGLSVDYSLHVGHSYIHETGTPNERMTSSLIKTGNAVANGAFSTWLAIIFLSGSESYVFKTFFKQLFLCTTLGSFHGIVVLPVLLTLFNPAPLKKHVSV